MIPKTLFLRSELIFWKHHSIVREHSDYLVVHTPDNPYWWWGNLIALGEPPRGQDIEYWCSLFDSELQGKQVYLHRQFIWQNAELHPEEAKPYIDCGFTVSGAAVLQLTELRPPVHYNAEMELVEVLPDSTLWPELLELLIHSFGPNSVDPAYRDYATRRLSHHRSLLATGVGHWYAAMVHGELAGSIAIFPGDGIARFQEIAVRDAFRRRGIAATMVHEVAKRAIDEWPDRTQIIVADLTGAAIRVYRTLGYEQVETSWALMEPAQNLLLNA